MVSIYRKPVNCYFTSYMSFSERGSARRMSTSAQTVFTGEFREGIPFLGSFLWIDFINTRPVINGLEQDLIGTAQAVRMWAQQANIGHYEGTAPDSPSALNALREQLAEAFDCLAAEKALPEALVAQVNRLIARSGVHLRVSSLGVEERVELVGPPVATAVAWDFARFLADFDHRRLRHCDSPACVMQFYDVGKNNRRRWCTMSLCGNRDKVAQYRERKASSRSA